MLNNSNYEARSRRENDTEKTDCIKNIKMLNNNLKLIEKDQNITIFNKKGDNYKDFSQFEEIVIKGDQERKETRAKIFQQINKANQMVKKFHNEVKFIKPIPETVENIRVMMENIESFVNALKDSARLQLEDLTNEERILTKEMEIFDKKIDTWQMQKNDGFKSERATSARNLRDTSMTSGDDLLPEVIAFDKFLVQNGGHKGNWDEYDHGIFLRIRTKHKGKPAFLEEVSSSIVTKTREEIERHETWFQEYTRLLEQKKSAIKQYMENKKKLREQIFTVGDNQRKIDEEKQKEIQKLMEEQRLLEKQERSKKLNEWKIEREIERAQEISKKRREEQRKQEEFIQKRQEQIEIKQRIEEQKRQKEEQAKMVEWELMVKEKAERDFRARMANLEITNFQQRDLQAVQEKLIREKRKAMEAEQKKKQIEEFKLTEFQVEKDPTRLYKMTQTWKERMKTPRAESCGPMHRIPHLAVPSWRQV